MNHLTEYDLIEIEKRARDMLELVNERRVTTGPKSTWRRRKDILADLHYLLPEVAADVAMLCQRARDTAPGASEKPADRQAEAATASQGGNS